jgi:uncharacterized protein (DUF58 family)
MKWILGTIALLMAGLVLQLNLLVYAMYVLLGILWLSRFFTRTWTEKIVVTRQMEGDVFEIGQSAEVSVEVENGGALTVPWLIIEDSLPREAITQMPHRLRVEGDRFDLISLKRGESAVLNYTVTFLMRGYYQLGPLQLETGDVFGLHRRFRVAGEPHFALVLPRVLPLQGYNLASRRPLGEIRVVHRLFEDPTRLAGVRPYQHGDPLNRIHWRATARTGEIHSRIYETSRVAGATFLLDFHVQSYQGAARETSAELAIVTVASLANAVFLMGQQIGFISNGRDAADKIREEGWRGEFTKRTEAQQRANDPLTNDRLRPVRVETRKGNEKLSQILETLARLEHTDGLEFSEMLAASISRIPRDATVVPVLRRVTPGIALALGELVKRGFLVTAVIVSIDWDIPEWSHPPEWAGLLLEQGIDFKLVNSEEAITALCAETIVR